MFNFLHNVEISSIVDFSGIGAWFVQIFYRAVAAIIKALGSLLDILNIAFYTFAGIDYGDDFYIVDKVTGEEENILSYFIFNDNVTKAYMWLVLIGLVLIAVFTIYKILKQDYFDRAGPRSKGPIFRNVAISCIAFVLVIPIFYLVIHVSSLLAVEVLSAMGTSMNSYAGLKLFELSWSDGGRAVHEVNRILTQKPNNIGSMYYLDNDVLFTLFARGKQVMHDPYLKGVIADSKVLPEAWGDFTLAKLPVAGTENTYYFYTEWYWYILLFAYIPVLKSLWTLILAMINRMFILLSLFIVAPAPISQYVLDEGVKAKKWLQRSIEEGLRVVSACVSFSIFLLAIGTIANIDFVSGMKGSLDAANGTAENLVNVGTDLLNYKPEFETMMYNDGLVMTLDDLSTQVGGAKLTGISSLFNAGIQCVLITAAAGGMRDIDATITELISGASKNSLNEGEAGKGVNSAVTRIGNAAMAAGGAALGATIGAIRGGIDANRAAKEGEEKAKKAEKPKDTGAGGGPNGGTGGGPNGGAGGGPNGGTGGGPNGGAEGGPNGGAEGGPNGGDEGGPNGGAGGSGEGAVSEPTAEGTNKDGTDTAEDAASTPKEVDDGAKKEGKAESDSTDESKGAKRHTKEGKKAKAKEKRAKEIEGLNKKIEKQGKKHHTKLAIAGHMLGGAGLGLLKAGNELLYAATGFDVNKTIGQKISNGYKNAKKLFEVDKDVSDKISNKVARRTLVSDAKKRQNELYRNKLLTEQQSDNFELSSMEENKSKALVDENGQAILGLEDEARDIEAQLPESSYDGYDDSLEKLNTSLNSSERERLGLKQGESINESNVDAVLEKLRDPSNKDITNNHLSDYVALSDSRILTGRSSKYNLEEFGLKGKSYSEAQKTIDENIARINSKQELSGSDKKELDDWTQLKAAFAGENAEKKYNTSQEIQLLTGRDGTISKLGIKSDSFEEATKEVKARMQKVDHNSDEYRELERVHTAFNNENAKSIYESESVSKFRKINNDISDRKEKQKGYVEDYMAKREKTQSSLKEYKSALDRYSEGVKSFDEIGDTQKYNDQDFIQGEGLIEHFSGRRTIKKLSKLSTSRKKKGVQKGIELTRDRALELNGIKPEMSFDSTYLMAAGEEEKKRQISRIRSANNSLNARYGDQEFSEYLKTNYAIEDPQTHETIYDSDRMLTDLEDKNSELYKKNRRMVAIYNSNHKDSPITTKTFANDVSTYIGTTISAKNHIQNTEDALSRVSVYGEQAEVNNRYISTAYSAVQKYNGLKKESDIFGEVAKEANNVERVVVVKEENLQPNRIDPKNHSYQITEQQATSLGLGDTTKSLVGQEFKKEDYSQKLNSSLNKAKGEANAITGGVEDAFKSNSELAGKIKKAFGDLMSSILDNVDKVDISQSLKGLGENKTDKGVQQPEAQTNGVLNGLGSGQFANSQSEKNIELALQQFDRMLRDGRSLSDKEKDLLQRYKDELDKKVDKKD